MTPEHWQRIKALLESALERKPGERSAFLAEACSGDESLRKEVESFIISHEQADSFIEEPAFEVMAESLEGKQEELVGHTLSHYKIHKQLGVGGMGEVYLAEDIRLGRKVAIKLLPDYFTKDDDRVLRFQQEARAASALNHPNILTIYEIGQTDSRHFIVTEFIEGQTLSQCLKAGMMKIPEALDIAIQIASALSAAHAAAIVHRDIKPDNVMVRADGIVKVLDFGLAKLTEQKGNELKAPNLVKTKQGVVMGSAHYMSPDQARGLQLDTRTDLFSLGAVLYEMVTGRMPFAGETMTDVLASILRVEPSALDQFRPEAPAEMQRIVAKALRKDKEERYQAAKELLSDLKTLKQRLEFERELQRSGEKLTASGEGKPAAGKVKSAGASKLRRKATLSPHPSRAAKSKAIDSLAVLPLINDSPDADMEYFSDGVTESIINALSQLPKLRVVARSTVFRYKGREVDPKEVGQQLGVRAVLTGRVRQTGDGLMIAAELIDVTNDSQLWGEHYSRALSDVFVVQEEIAKEISEKLRLKLTGEEKKRLAKRHTGSTEAYKLYLKGLYYWNKRTVECLKKGIEYFEQAIEMDPNYALAYAGLADSYVLLGRYEALSPKESFPKAKAAAMKALQIDPGLAEAFPSLASAKFKYDWDWAGAERDFKHGIELNPNCATARHWYGHYLWCLGRFDEAFKQTQQALQLDPLSLMIDVSSTTPYFYARQYDQVIENCRRILDLHPNFPPAHTR